MSRQGAVRWHALRVLAGYAALGAVVTLAALPLTVAVEPATRPLLTRLAAALVLGIALVHIRSAARRSLGAGAAPARDHAGRSRREEPTIARHFQEVLDDLRFGSASQSYWERVLLPRLSSLADRLPGHPRLEEPPRSRLRRMLGLGPNLATLRDVVARLERQERP